MKKIIKIGMILAVLLSMAGYASATTTIAPSPVLINIYNNEVKILTIEHTDELYEPITARFFIRDDGYSTINTELTGSWDGTNWGQQNLYGAPDTCTHAAGVWTATWTFQVTDNGDLNDDTQLGTEYDLHFEVFDVDSNLIGTKTERGSATSDVSAVPEFPTIALPMAAILGLAFIFQRRKEED